MHGSRRAPEWNDANDLDEPADFALRPFRVLTTQRSIQQLRDGHGTHADVLR
jgi:hypothetical protein